MRRFFFRDMAFAGPEKLGTLALQFSPNSQMVAIATNET